LSLVQPTSLVSVPAMRCLDICICVWKTILQSIVPKDVRLKEAPRENGGFIGWKQGKPNDLQQV